MLSLPLAATTDNPAPPSKPVKLVFVHHSSGENLLADGNGNLGRVLGMNNYFVSDANYGWGPNDIGDRTDIINWPEWFAGPQSSTYTRALYRLNSTNSPFARSNRDPGGENSIIMFKSCFPNSALQGRPDDPAGRGDGLSVGNAKAIYNGLLRYFASRPDKLFIAITAPPLREHSLAHNARAFNNWLVHDWLKEYGGKNVAAFDFYNILTGPNNHHRFHNGKIEHTVQGGNNTLYYHPGDDTHPTAAGNRKATAELVPLLNVYYHRWQAWLPSAPKLAAYTPPTPDAAEPRPPQDETLPRQTTGTACATAKPPSPGGLIDNFEDASRGWEVFSDGGHPKTRLACGRAEQIALKGKAALAIDYDIAPESWAICGLVLPAVENWSGVKGISLYLRTEQKGQKLSIIAYGGDNSSRLTHFEHHVTSNPANIGQWQKMELTWDQFVQPPWEGDGTAKFDPTKAKGVAFAFSTPNNAHYTGKVWVDEVKFLE